MEEHECSFCKTGIEAGTGKMYVKKDGSLLYFCSNRCEKNMMKLKRLPRKVKWVTKKKKAEAK